MEIKGKYWKFEGNIGNLDKYRKIKVNIRNLR